MLQHSRAAKRGEGGFTLIELLVVMIIIAILMAVAVPTFLKQKQNAIKSQATSNVKQIVNAVEACAAGNVDGSYTNCTSFDLVARVEPTLNNIQPRPTIVGNATSYAVTVGTNTGATFTETHTDNGEINKTCTAPNEASRKACPTGTW